MGQELFQLSVFHKFLGARLLRAWLVLPWLCLPLFVLATDSDTVTPAEIVVDASIVAGTDMLVDPEPAYGLVDILDLALTHDHGWAAAQARFQASQESVPQARAELLPRVILSGNVGETRRESSGGLGGTNTRTYSQDTLRLQARQPVYNREARLGLDIAQRDVNVAGLELALAREDLLERVVHAYLDLLIAQERLNLIQREEESLRAQRDQAQRMRDTGVATVTDVQETQARLDLLHAQAIQARGQRDMARQQLRRLTATPIDSIRALATELRLPDPDPAELDAWTTLAAEQSLLVQARSELLQRETLGISRARSQHLPTVDVVAAYERFSNSDLGFSRDEYARLQLEFNLPLYLGGRVNSQTRRARAAQQEAAEQLNHSQRDSELMAAQAYVQLTDSLARIAALEQAMRSSATALRAAEVSLTVAYRTFIDVLNAQQQLYEARFQRLNAQADYMRAFIDLHAAIGALDDDLIARMDRWLTTRP